jgi:methanol--5-hydroxybenzimidazolylcobamide Co-methyltransferase
MRYQSLAIDEPKGLVFGHAPKPLTTRDGMVIGGGTVWPELNFTLPPMLLEDDTFPAAMGHYRQIVTDALARAADLFAPGVVLEFETLPPMTHRPQWALDIVGILLDGMAAARDRTGLKSVLRMTPNDNREMIRRPAMRSGEYWDNMLKTFDGAAARGAELLSIESVGGKEVHDIALTYCDLPQAIFALCVMGVRDMRFLWRHIAEIAASHGMHAAGDTACGFGNTAMVLADRKMIPRVFAAVDRAVCAVRSLVAYECGAVGPGKDCGYENPILKVITGLPMAMEGKSASCAHLSPLGNLPMAMCDTWSNESVQNVKLLGGMAPTVSMEQLIYDCRLLNEAASDGPDGALKLRDWLVAGDAPHDVQAFILSPECVIALAREIVSAKSHYLAGKAVARKAIELIRKALADGAVRVEPRELPFLDAMQASLGAMPDDEDEFIAEMMRQVETDKFIPADYELV